MTQLPRFKVNRIFTDFLGLYNIPIFLLYITQLTMSSFIPILFPCPAELEESMGMRLDLVQPLSQVWVGMRLNLVQWDNFQSLTKRN